MDETEYLRSIGVVEHAIDNVGHGVNCIIRVSWRSERRQVVLQSFTQHTVKGDVRPEDVTLLPAILLQLLHPSPQTVQILRGDRKGQEQLGDI